MIDWKARLKNKMFWISLIPALLLLVQQVVGLFGVSLQTEALGQKLVDLVGAIFAVLALMGVVADPTTPGLRDGEKPSEALEGET